MVYEYDFLFLIRANQDRSDVSLKRRPRSVLRDKCDVFVLFFFLLLLAGRRPRLHSAQVWSLASTQEDTRRHASVSKACGSIEIISGASVRLMAPPGPIQWP